MLTVFIPTAGLGSRLKSKTKNQNKSLITLNNKAIISHIIEKFNPKKTEFIIALGHKADYVKQYLIVAHPSLKLRFMLSNSSIIFKSYFLYLNFEFFNQFNCFPMRLGEKSLKL